MNTPVDMPLDKIASAEELNRLSFIQELIGILKTH